jgi:hypothetical protein
MQLQFLTDEGLNEKYYNWKDIIIHSILIPVLTITDDRHTFHVFGAKTTPELHKQYNKDLVARVDKNYNQMIYNETVFLVQLVKESDIELAKQAGHMHDGIFSVFKDDLLKANPITLITSFKALDPKELLKEKFN